MTVSIPARVEEGVEKKGAMEIQVHKLSATVRVQMSQVW